MRISALSVLIVSACRIGEYIAPDPAAQLVDGGGGGAVDAAAPGIDGPPAFQGLRATIGERPEWSGTCGALDDHAEMSDRFDPAVQQQNVRAGWDFETGADSYNDPSYGFDPPWPSAESGRFSVRFRGRIQLEAGTTCFSIDIGATGNDIVGGKNACGQIWIGAGSSALAETGYEAATAGVATGCVDRTAAGPVEIEIVYWYFNIFEPAKLRVRQCTGAACTPNQPLSVPALEPL